MLRFYSLPFLFMLYFDAFSGVGGFSLPLTELGHECVGFSEIDEKASQVYRFHFPSHSPYGDITRIDAAALPDFDVLCGGFPCQSFSIAGKRGGFADTRGTLFFDLARILQAKQPRMFLFENVKGLLSHDGGRTVRTIIAALAELGYDVQWEVLNSRHFGVPQNRERIFIAGHLGGFPGSQVFPVGQGVDDAGEADGQEPGIPIPPITCQGGRNCRGAFIGRWVNKQSGVALDDTAPSLRASGGTDIRKMPVVIARNQRGEVREMEIAGTVTANRSGKQFQLLAEKPIQLYPGHSVPHETGVANTLKAGVHGMPGGEGLVMLRDGRDNRSCLRAKRQTEVGFAGQSVRRLTPVETERLQSFPDGWTEFGIDENCEKVRMSDTSRYRMMGNAVTCNVVREIVKRLPPRA